MAQTPASPAAETALGGDSLCNHRLEADSLRRDVEGLPNCREETLGALQPPDSADIGQNTRLTIEHCSRNPQWKLCIQVHKSIGVD